VGAIASVVEAAQASGVPCFFTRFELERDGSDIGVYGRKRALLDSPHWCLAGTRGAELVPQLRPGPRDIVFVKKKPSGFHGTPLLGYLVDRQVDTVIVVGGATSNCIRATVFDASSWNFRVIVPHQAVFDRIPVSHAISLFDMDRQFADVVEVAETVSYLQDIGRRAGEAAHA
jgi:nicotinamidase-related amidase